MVVLLAIFCAVLPCDLNAKTNYKKWLEEEVVWIISNAEREKFRQLKDDSTREAFIEEFWRRRDPTPSTPRNEYKEEHYRRLLYATRMFQEGIPGWKSDRGRVYILHGPPDREQFFRSLSTISLNQRVPSTHRTPNTIVWSYHKNNSARYYKGEIRLVFQPSSGLTRQNFVMGESKTAQEKADQLAALFGPAADQNWMEADVRYQLIVAGPPALMNARGADIPNAGGGEVAHYMDDLFRSPGEILEEQRKEIERREQSRSELRQSVSSKVSFELKDFYVSHQSFFQKGRDWLIPLTVEIPLKGLKDEKIDLYAALLAGGGKIFDEFLDSVEVDGSRPERSDSDRLKYLNVFSAPSGDYTLRVVIREVKARRSGYRDVPVRLSAGDAPKLRLGSVMVTNRIEVDALSDLAGPDLNIGPDFKPNTVIFNGTRLIPNPSGSFHSGENLFIYLQVWTARPGSEISLSANFIQNGQIVKRLPPRALQKSETNFLEYGTVIPLTGFESGQYILQIQMLDPATKEFAIQRTALSISDGGQ
ncbi:MAG TPA: GWxTD domain-containing protein [Acidobacteriota bacterium]|jgi:GWxTD domain-containing protein